MNPAGSVSDAPVSRVARTLLPGFCAAAAFALLRSARNRSDLTGREIGVAVTAAAIASGTLSPSARRGLDAVTGDANYGRFVSQIGTAVAAAYGDSVMIRSARDHTESESKVRVRRRRMAGTLAAMTALFAVNRPAASELQLPTHALYRPITAAYWLVFSGFMTQTAAELAPLAYRTSKMLPERSFRLGLRGVAVGSAVIGVFYGQFFIATVAGVRSRRFPEPLRGVRAQNVIQLGAACIAIGACLPSTVAQWQATRPRIEDVRMSIQLGPVWRHVRKGAPAVTLSVGLFSKPEVRLLRRVVEIQGGLDRLASRRDPTRRLRAAAEEVGQEHGLDTGERGALHRAALLRYDTDHPRPVSEDQPSDQGPVGEMFASSSRGLTNFHQEARQLLQVRQLLNRSRLPGLVAQRAFSELHDPRGDNWT